MTTDLMYAGLNSLSAIKAAAIITERTGKKLATPDILRERTAEKIAALLENGEDYQEQTFDKKEAYPLTANQLGLYFACMKEPGSLVYNIPMELAFEKADPEQLKESVIRVIDAHSYVKTRFELRNNEPVQLRRDEDAVEIPIRKCTQEEYETRKESFVRPFELFGGVLYRIEIFCTPDKIYMLCDFHHMIFDGGSMDIFLRDLTDAYVGKQILPERFSSFDLALLEAEHAKGEEQEKAKAFYHERLYDGEGATIIPIDGTGEGQPVTMYAYVAKNKVEAAIKGLGVTPSNLFLASVLFVTGRFASARNVRIATITNGREGVQVQNNLGMLVKTLPLAMNLVSEDTAGDYLSKVQQEMSETLNHLAYTYMQASSDYNYHAQLLYAYQGGVKNGVAFAKKKGCRFVQVSTASIAGMSIDGTPDESIKLSEQMLYFGQDLSNKYARSKFLAERIILAEALQGLDAKIIRVGNLMAREFDGEFQMNFRTNNFLGRLKAYHTIGKISYEAMSMNCEFAPIDSTAKAVLLLGQTPENVVSSSHLTITVSSWAM